MFIGVNERVITPIVIDVAIFIVGLHFNISQALPVDFHQKISPAASSFLY